MGARAGWVLVATATAAVVAGCDASSTPAPRPAESTVSSSAPDEGPAAAPQRGQPASDDLPRCFGRRATVVGTAGPDRVTGTPDRDVVVTRGGDDEVRGLRAEDRVCTGGGDDTVHDVDHWQVQVELGRGHDRLHGVAQIAVLWAGPGDDRLRVPSSASAVVALGAGDDRIRTLDDGARRRPYNTPCVSYAAAPGPVVVDLTRDRARGQGADRLVGVRCLFGTRWGDRIVGSPDSDDLDVGSGDNVVHARGGDDVVYSNAAFGADVFHLGPGDDSAMPGMGPDRVHGGPGEELVEAANGGDHVEGGAGDDVLHASYRCDFGNSGGAGTVDMVGNEIFGGAGDDYLTGDLGNDRIDGGPGSDRGQGGYRDGRVDWIESLETFVRC